MMKCAVLLRAFSLPNQSKAFRKGTWPMGARRDGAWRTAHFGRAKNSARRGCLFGPSIVRAGFEPHPRRAITNSRAPKDVCRFEHPRGRHGALSENESGVAAQIRRD